MLEERKQIVASIAASLGPACQGIASAFPSSALPQMTDPSSEFYLNDQQASLMVGVLMFSAAFGNVSAATLMNLVGRKRLLLCCSIPLIAGFVFVAAATNELTLLIGRFLIGATTGIAIPTSIVYISEITQPSIRGVMVNFPLLLSGAGSLMEYFLGVVTPDWRIMTWISLCVPVGFFLTMLFMPMSPRFLLMKNKEKEAIEALKNLRNRADDLEEIKAIKAHLQQNSNRSFKDSFLKPYNIKVFIYCLLIGMFYGGCGGRVFISFIEPLSIEMDSPISPKTISLIVGVTLVIVPIFVLLLAKRIGLRKFLQLSGLLMTIFCFCLVLFFTVIGPKFPEVAFLGYLPPAFFILYMTSFCFGYYTLALAVSSEIAPMELRGFFAPISAMASALSIASFSYAYVYMIKYLQLFGYFSVFMGMSMCTFLFPTLFLPETKGKTLEEIEMIVQKKGIFMGL